MRENGERRPYRAAAWTPEGDYKVALYAPGERADALPGSPTYPDHWVSVWWFPGKRTFPVLHASEEDAKQHWCHWPNDE